MLKLIRNDIEAIDHLVEIVRDKSRRDFTIIYHAPCMDGFTAAWVMKNWLDSLGVHSLGVHSLFFIEGVYGELPDRDKIEGRDVFIVDFSYDVPTMLGVDLGSARSVLVLDHHKTAIERLNGWLEENPDGFGENVTILLDQERSGAGLAWDVTHPGMLRPRLVNYVQDRDLWRWQIPHSHEVNAFLALWNFDFKIWDGLADQLESDLSEPVSIGVGIERRNQILVERIVESSTRWVKLGGSPLAIPAANSSIFQSEVGHALCEKHKTAIYAAIWHVTAEGKVSVSLRSEEISGADCAEIAGRFGGGGHEHAAGFTIESVEKARDLGLFGWPDVVDAPVRLAILAIDESKLVEGARFETHAGNIGTVIKEPFQHGAHRVCEVTLECNGRPHGGHPFFSLDCIVRILDERDVE